MMRNLILEKMIYQLDINNCLSSNILGANLSLSIAIDKLAPSEDELQNIYFYQLI